MTSQIVRYPRANLWIPSMFLAISVLGLVKAINGTGHWTFPHVAFFAALGVFYLIYFLISQTVFSSDGIKQRNGIGQTVNYQYPDVQRIELVGIRNGFALILSTSDGRKLKVYGPTSQLIAAQQLLRERVPQAFDDGLNEELPSIADKKKYTRLWRKRTLYSGTALFLSSASVYPFLAGHSLHGHWDSIGKYLVLMSMGLLFVLLCCAVCWLPSVKRPHAGEDQKAYLLRIAEHFKGYRRLWEPSLELCVSAMDSALEDLTTEALASRYFMQGDPSVDLRFVPMRTTITLGWLAGFSIYRRLKGNIHPKDFEMYGKVLDHFTPHGLDFWGEGGAPCLFLMALFVWCYGVEGRACRITASAIRTISQANRTREAVGLPDAYFQPKDLIDAFVRGESPFGYGQSFTGRSQSIGTFIEFIARRSRKKLLQQQWYGISDIDLAEFVPTNPADIYRWRCRKGDSQTRKWARPQEWDKVLETAEQKSTPPLLLCSGYPELLSLFFLVFPHRMTPHLSRHLDYAVMEQDLG